MSDLEITSLSAIDHVLTHASERCRWFSCNFQGNQRVKDLLKLAKSNGVEVRETKSEPVLRVLPFEFAAWEFVETLSSLPRATVLILDHLQDPQNFGAIIRSAEAFGVSAVIIPKDRSVTVTPAVYTASSGAIETINIVLVTNLNDRIVRLKKEGFWIVGAHLTDKSTEPWSMPTFEKVALIVGTEFEGLRDSTVSHCDWVVKIPIQGKIDSLNVSAAAAILLYEFNVRRNVK